MRDDLVLTPTARQLRTAGLTWQPQIGDWCALLDGIYLADQRAGLWLVIESDPQVGWATVLDSGGRWPPARVAASDALWLPTAGQLKGWLRSQGYHVVVADSEPGLGSMPQTSSSPARGWAAGILAPPPSSAGSGVGGTRCTLTRPGRPEIIQRISTTEAEAVADALLLVLWEQQRPL